MQNRFFLFVCWCSEIILTKNILSALLNILQDHQWLWLFEIVETYPFIKYLQTFADPTCMAAPVRLSANWFNNLIWNLGEDQCQVAQYINFGTVYLFALGDAKLQMLLRSIHQKPKKHGCIFRQLAWISLPYLDSWY